MDVKRLAGNRFQALFLAVIVVFFIFLAVRWYGIYSSPPEINVFIVGNASTASWTEMVYPEGGGTPYERTQTDLVSLLQAEDFKIAGIFFRAELNADFLVPGVLDAADVVVLYNAPVCDRTARQVLADFVKAGGRLVVVGDACTRVVDSPQAGWSIGQNDLAAMMPAIFEGTHDVDVRLKIYDIDHPLFNGIKNFQVQGRATLVRPTANASVLAFLNSTDVESGNALYGIVEKPYGRGRVVYFAFDPVPSNIGGSRNLWINLLLYLARR